MCLHSNLPHNKSSHAMARGIFPADIFLHHLLSQNPSQDTFKYLRSRRGVDINARDIVDSVMADALWRKPWLTRAHEFCNDLAPGMLLAPGAPTNAGLERMIRSNQMAQLVEGMDEFLMDENTQQLCMQQLQAMMLPPYMPNTVNNNLHPYLVISWARATPGLFRSIVGSLRTHPTNMVIQMGGMAVLSAMMPWFTGPHDVPLVSRRLADYTIATLIASVNANMHSPALAAICLTTLLTLIEMHTDTHTVAYPPFLLLGEADPPFLMSGECNIAGFVVTLMHLNEGDDMSVRNATSLLVTLLHNAENPQKQESMQKFNVCLAEDHIISCMPLVPHMSLTQVMCLNALTILYDKFRLRVRRPTDVMACAHQALLLFGCYPDVRDVACKLMNMIITVFWSQTAPARVLTAGQIRPTVTNIMSLVACSLRAQDVNTLSKCTCTTIFNMLSMLLENQHPHHTDLVNERHTLTLLTNKYHEPVEPDVDAAWQHQHDRLAAILAPPFPLPPPLNTP